MNTASFTQATTVLTELTSLGMRAARVAVRLIEIEQAAGEVIAEWLPEPGLAPACSLAAVEAGREVDAVTSALHVAVPRTEILTRALDRLSRSVRRSVALQQRIEAGWPRAAADTRDAMVRRQVARGVGAAITRECDGDTAERLFDDLAERLAEPGFDEEIGALPVEVAVRRICQDLGLAGAALQPFAPGTTTVDTS